MTNAASLTVTNLRDAPEFDVLAETIRTISKRRELVFIPSPGNWGDALINVGTEQFLAANGFAPRVLKRDEFLAEIDVGAKPFKNAVVLVGGGGGWCENWHSTRNFLEAIGTIVRDIIVLPTTYELSVDHSRRSNVIYFRRDNGGSKAVAPHSTFCHDMAFFLDVDRLEPEPHAWRIKAFRGDKERSPDAHSTEPSVDISMLGNSYHGVRPFFQILSRFDVIHTDRLHVAIAGSMLGKRAVLMPGNYAKARDVWSSSLEPNFANAKFKEWADYKPD